MIDDSAKAEQYTDSSEFQISAATERDLPAILDLIRALADYEQLSHEVTTDEARLRGALFGPQRHADVLLGREGEQVVAFAVFFYNFSTFLGRPGLYLEDLFVRPAWRGRGYGRRMLARLAQLAVARGCGRMEWSVLDWNDPAIAFYKKLGAKPMDEWTVFRLTGDALATLAGRDAAGQPV